MRHIPCALALVVAAAGCGGPSPASVSTQGTGGATPSKNPVGGTNTGGGTPTTGGSFEITISNLSYSPLNLNVPPGATVTVVNDDGMPHSVTSEASIGSYVHAAVNGISFDTGEFSSGQKTFTIPASAPNGTVIPYYCVVHRQTMNTPNGTITVSTSATPPSSGTSAPPAAPAAPRAAPAGY